MLMIVLCECIMENIYFLHLANTYNVSFMEHYFFSNENVIEERKIIEILFRSMFCLQTKNFCKFVEAYK